MLDFILREISTYIWLLPPFRQFKTKLFLLFLILGISYPVHLLVRLVAQDFAFSTFLINLILISIFLFDKTVIDRYWWIILLCIFSIFSVYLNTLEFLNWKIHWGLATILFINILFVFIYRFSAELILNKRISVPDLILILYYSMSTFKFIGTLLNLDIGIVFYGFTTQIQILFALFFTVYRTDDERLFPELPERFKA